MLFLDKLHDVQKKLTEQELDGWLFYDFHGSNPLDYQFLEIPPGKMMTRRFFYWIPQDGTPIKIVPSIEPSTLDHIPGEKRIYLNWQELEEQLLSLCVENSRLAMEYSPYNALPTISKVDAGTIELIRRNGAEIVSSANLLQAYTSIWTPEQFTMHLEAANVLETVVHLTWQMISNSIKLGDHLTEWQVQQFIMQEINKRGFISADLPICAINQHSADPHYMPHPSLSAKLKKGDWVLLDLWCKKDHPEAVYADITRVGVLSSQPTFQQQELFSIVNEAQDAAMQYVKEKYSNGLAIQGWQVDDVCRAVIRQAGYEKYFIHRTGHNIGKDVHGSGANFDNLETHDFRFLLPGMCFSVEPGIYLPQQFGVRLEYDLYLDSNGQALVTGGIQNEIVCLLI